MVKSFNSFEYNDLFDLWTLQSASGNTTLDFGDWEYIGTGQTGGTSQTGKLEDGAGVCIGGSSDGDSLLRSKIDLRVYRLVSFSFSGVCGGKSSSGGRGSSGTARLSITDGSNSQELCSATFSESSSGNPTGAGASVGGYFLLEISNGNVKVWHQASGSSGDGGDSSSSNWSVITDETNVDISSWSNLFLEISANKGGSNGDGSCKSIISNIMSTKKIIGSKRKYTIPE